MNIETKPRATTPRGNDLELMPEVLCEIFIRVVAGSRTERPSRLNSRRVFWYLHRTSLYNT